MSAFRPDDTASSDPARRSGSDAPSLAGTRSASDAAPRTGLRSGADPDRLDALPPRLPVIPFVEALGRRWRRVAVLTLVAGATAAALALIWPVTYEATLTIMPPDTSSPFNMGGDIAANLARLQLGFNSSVTTDLYVDMLQSRSVVRYAVDKLDLLHVYHLSGKDTLTAYAYAYGALKNDMSIRTANSGILTLDTRAHTKFFPDRKAKEAARQLSAALGNALAEGLEMVNQHKTTNQARQARQFLEEQLTTTDEKLRLAGKALSEFQQRNLAISIDDQMRVGIETAGKLEGDLLGRELELGIALNSMQPSNPEVRRLQDEIREIRRQLGGVERGGPAGAAGDSMDHSLASLPEIGRKYATLLREVTIQERLYEILTEQFYQARIKESETLPVVQVLDEAGVPAFKKSPIVRKIALMAAALGFLVGIFLVQAEEWWARYAWRQADSAALRRLFGR